MQGLEHKIEDREDLDDPYPYHRTFAEAKHEPFVVLHTSGSTGLPQPITQTHATNAPLEAYVEMRKPGEEPPYPWQHVGARFYSNFPLFHASRIILLLAVPAYIGGTIVLGPFPPPAEVANAVHVHGNVRHSLLAPMVLVEIAKKSRVP